MSGVGKRFVLMLLGKTVCKTSDHADPSYYPTGFIQLGPYNSLLESISMGSIDSRSAFPSYNTKIFQ